MNQKLKKLDKVDKLNKNIVKYKILTLIVTGLLVVTYVSAQDTSWEVPTDKAEKTAPFLFTSESADFGKEIYLKNCKSCHGDMGQHNMVKMNPLPKDLTIDSIQVQSDGSLYYKIKNGRGSMPKFESVLSVTDKWNVIAYIRSFNENYEQPKPAKVKLYKGGIVTLSLNWLANKDTLQVVAMGKKDEKETPVVGVEVALFAERYYGNLKLGDNAITNEQGIATFSFIEKIPGDSVGKLNITAKLTNVEQFGDIVAKGIFKAGEPMQKPSLTEERAMWNVGSKSPWWLLVAYPVAVLAVLATLLYIALLVRKIFILGKQNDKN